MEFNINMYWMLNKYEVDKQLKITRYKKKKKIQKSRSNKRNYL